MEQLIDRVVRARESLYSGAIDSEDFVAIKDNCEKRINTLGIQLQQLITLKLTKTDHLRKLSKNIYEMACLYDKTDLISKRQIVVLMFSHSTIYKEQIKLMFDPALKILFNIDSCIHSEMTITDETFVFDDE